TRPPMASPAFRGAGVTGSSSRTAGALMLYLPLGSCRVLVGNPVLEEQELANAEQEDHPEQEHRHGGGLPEPEIAERDLVDPQVEDLGGVTGAALGQHVQRVEHLE